MKKSNDFLGSDNDFNLTKTESEYDDLSISLTYSLNIKSVIINRADNSENTEIHSTTFFKIPNFKCLNCATDMCYYKSKETEKSDITILCNLCGIEAGANAEGFLLCRNCDFHLCHKCRVCSNGHYLKKIYEFNVEKLPDFLKNNFMKLEDFKCNLCNGKCYDLKNKQDYECSPFYICWTCVYFLCNKCMLKTKGVNI